MKIKMQPAFWYYKYFEKYLTKNIGHWNWNSTQEPHNIFITQNAFNLEAAKGRHYIV